MCSLILAIAAGTSYSNAVNLFDSDAGKWSVSQLSLARYGLAATSVGNVALFAGGEISELT